MSFKGVFDARCPNGCDSEEIEIWSFVRGDKDPLLRETLLGGELNLVLCEHCNEPFYAEAAVIYLDEGARFLAFIFPESHRAEEARWRAKMAEDFATLHSAMPDLRLPEPQLFFGFLDIREALRTDDEMADEVDIARFLGKKLGFGVFAADRAFARARRLPWDLPLGRGKAFSRESVLEALRALLKANDRLEGYRRWIELLETTEELPPAEAGSGTAPAAPQSGRREK